MQLLTPRRRRPLPEEPDLVRRWCGPRDYPAAVLAATVRYLASRAHQLRDRTSSDPETRALISQISTFRRQIESTRADEHLSRWAENLHRQFTDQTKEDHS